jgi:hypothetical protein
MVGVLSFSSLLRLGDKAAAEVSLFDVASSGKIA